jgi:hypothetical protein
VSRTARALLSVSILCALAGALAGVAAHLAATRDQPAAPELFERDFELQRPAAGALELGDARPVTIPHPFADFDLIADLEVPAGGALDLVLRLVEPRRSAEGDMPLFHGRFAVLRLAADGRQGPAFLSREQALFDAAGNFGQAVAAGLPATVVVEARGRWLRANVAGVWHGPFEADDAHGAVMFVVRGGTGLVHGLRIDTVPRPLRLLPISWCAILGALAGLAACGLARGRLRRALPPLLLVPVVGWLAGAVLVPQLLPATEPGVAALVLAALAGVPGALGLAAARGPRSALLAAVLGLAGAFAAFEGFARLERPRIEAFEDPRLDAHFGAQSGTGPLDALTRRLHGRTAVHTVEADGQRVLCLGGGPLFEGSPDRAEWVAPIAAGRASQALGRRVECAVAPTLYGHVRQQLAMFERFYAEAFAPAVVVLAIPPWEGEASERAAAVAVLDGAGAAAAAAGPSALLELWARRRAPRVAAIADAAAMRRALDELARLSVEHGFRVVLVEPPALEAGLAAAVRAGAAEHGFERLVLPLLDAPGTAIEPLAEVLVRELGR